MYEDDYLMEDQIMTPLKFNDQSNQYILYCRQSMKTLDEVQLSESVVKEINGHIYNKVWE